MMASGLNLFWATSSAGYGCYSYTRNNNKDQQNQCPKLRPKPEARLPRRRWGETHHANNVPIGTLGSKYNRIFLENCQRVFAPAKLWFESCLWISPVIGI